MSSNATTATLPYSPRRVKMHHESYKYKVLLGANLLLILVAGLWFTNFSSLQGCLQVKSSAIGVSDHNNSIASTANNHNDSFAMALADSDGFFDNISDKNWKLIKQRVKERVNHFVSLMHNIHNSPAWYQENFEPDFTCMHERRVGSPPMGDGPKWVCDPHRLKNRECLVYSVGSEGNFMFEEAVLKLIGSHCEIHTFDPDASYGANAPPGVTYHAWGFTSEQEAKQGNFKTMNQTVKELNHTGRTIDIFKIDCEGCEWTTFGGWFSAGATLRQILVEVHNTPDEAPNFFLSMQEAGYVTFHKEPNIQWGGGKCVEYAFLKLEKTFFQDSSNVVEEEMK